MQKETQMQIIIDTDKDEFESAVGAVYAAFGEEMFEWDEGDASASPAPTIKNGSDVLPGGWTEKKLRKWANYLRPDAQEVVRYVAANAPEVDYDDVAEHLGEWKGEDGPIDGKFLGGVMSSGGHALNRIPGKPNGQPIDRDHGKRMYVIDERSAKILADVLGEPGDPGDGVDWDDEE